MTPFRKDTRGTATLTIANEVTAVDGVAFHGEMGGGMGYQTHLHGAQGGEGGSIADVRRFWLVHRLAMANRLVVVLYAATNGPPLKMKHLSPRAAPVP